MTLRFMLGTACAVAWTVMAAGAHAQDSRAGVLLTLPTSPRGLALGDGGIAAPDGAWSLFRSPAELAAVRGASVGVAFESYLSESKLVAASYALPAFGGVFGAGVTSLRYGSVAEVVPTGAGDGVETGRSVSADDAAFVAAYSRTVPSLGGVRLGASGEVIQSHIVDLSGTAAALSASVAWTAGNGWSVAAAAQHLGSKLTVGVTHGDLPATLRAGVASPLYRAGAMSWRGFADVASVRGGSTDATVGGEAAWHTARGMELALRAAYAARDASTEARRPFTAGGGVTLGRYALDYAVESFAGIGELTQRVGLHASWPR